MVPSTSTELEYIPCHRHANATCVLHGYCCRPDMIVPACLSLSLNVYSWYWSTYSYIPFTEQAQVIPMPHVIGMAIAADLAWPPYLECRESGGLGPRLSAATLLKPRLLHFIGSYSCFVVSTRRRGSPSAGLLLPWQPQRCVVRDVQIVLKSPLPPPPPFKSITST